MARPLTKSIIVGQRRLLLLLPHVVVAALSNWLAFLLRFDGNIPAQEWDLFAAMLPLLLAMRALTLYPFRFYDGIWWYTSLWDLRNLALSIAVSFMSAISVLTLIRPIPLCASARPAL